MTGRDDGACAQSTSESTKRILELNDQHRAGRAPGRVALTQGVLSLPRGELVQLMQRIQTFTDFTPDNDPHGEHDFGTIDHAGQRIFWKIDYYDRTLKFGSPDPADPDVTTRVMTVMLASEY